MEGRRSDRGQEQCIPGSRTARDVRSKPSAGQLAHLFLLGAVRLRLGLEVSLPVFASLAPPRETSSARTRSKDSIADKKNLSTAQQAHL